MSATQTNLPHGGRGTAAGSGGAGAASSILILIASAFADPSTMRRMVPLPFREVLV